MAGLLGYALAGAVGGYGEGLVAEAKSKREEALRRLENDMIRGREGEDRAFRKSERLAGQEFESEQNRLRIGAEMAKAAVPKPQSTVAKLKADFDAGLIDEGTYKAAVKKATQQSGMVVYDANGNPIFEQGSGVGLGKTGQNNIDERMINTAEMGARVANVMAGFKPEYQTLGGKWTNMISSGKAFLDPELLSPEETQALSDFASYRSTALENLNSILKEMSGAAVTPQEYERIKGVMPNAGTGLFDGDDPVTFQAKMQRAMEDAEKALARYRYYKTVGMPATLEDIPLANVKKIDGQWYVKKGEKVFRVAEEE